MRFADGIVITTTGLVGRQAIVALNRCSGKAKLAEALPDVERRKELSYDTALARLAKKVCPGCERPIDLSNTVDYCPLSVFASLIIAPPAAGTRVPSPVSATPAAAARTRAERLIQPSRVTTISAGGLACGARTGKFPARCRAANGHRRKARSATCAVSSRRAWAAMSSSPSRSCR